MIYEPDENFRLFAGNLKAAIQRYATDEDEELLVVQKRQFDSLTSFESAFRKELIRSDFGHEAYSAFIRRICDENGNILTSRPYFRERQPVCIGPISQALQKRSPAALYQYHFNYNFVAFVMGLKKWPAKSKLAKLAKKIAAMRQEIVEMNSALAISEAKKFWGKTAGRSKDTRFSYMDFIQVAIDGLISAVDKFVVPQGEAPESIRVWRAVAIGRMRGNFIETYSETTLHFYPQDKRKIYRATKHLWEFTDGVDYERLAVIVNSSGDGPRTTANELISLMAASARVSSATPAGQEDGMLERFEAARESQPDVQFEQAEAIHSMHEAIKALSIMEQKILKLKGVVQS
jgi:hypothetical protein